MSQPLEASFNGASAETAAPAASRFRWIGWSSFLLAILQSVCAVFAALSGLRLLLGAAAFASAIGAMQTFDGIFHRDAIRIPMVAFALVGAFFNLIALWQVRRLRSRPSAAWRQQPVAQKKLTSEWAQLALSILTLMILAAESYYHHRMFHHF